MFAYKIRYDVFEFTDITAINFDYWKNEKTEQKWKFKK